MLMLYRFLVYPYQFRVFRAGVIHDPTGRTSATVPLEVSRSQMLADVKQIGKDNEDKHENVSLNYNLVTG